jgi:hypothetical protein
MRGSDVVVLFRGALEGSVCTVDSGWILAVDILPFTTVTSGDST